MDQRTDVWTWVPGHQDIRVYMSSGTYGALYGSFLYEGMAYNDVLPLQIVMVKII